MEIDYHDLVRSIIAKEKAFDEMWDKMMKAHLKEFLKDWGRRRMVIITINRRRIKAPARRKLGKVGQKIV